MYEFSTLGVKQDKNGALCKSFEEYPPYLLCSSHVPSRFISPCVCSSGGIFLLIRAANVSRFCGRSFYAGNQDRSAGKFYQNIIKKTSMRVMNFIDRIHYFQKYRNST